MRKDLFFPLLLAAFPAFAQEPADALRFSYTLPSGTARHQATGGAMGALGGDYSATFVNPAGLGFYRTNDAVFSPSWRWGDNRGRFFGRDEKASDTRFEIGAAGVVIGSNGPQQPNRSFAWSLGISQQASFRQELLYRGRNDQSSYSQRFLEELQRSGIRDSTAAFRFPFGSSLALNTFWLDPVRDATGAVTGFSTNSPLTTGLLQEQYIRQRGGIYEAALGGGGQVSDNLFIGGTVGIPILVQRRYSTFTEADATSDTSNRFDFAEFREALSTSGIGLNLRLGIIYKPAESWRLGLAVHTPTLYTLTESFSYELTTDTENYEGEWTDKSIDYNDGKKNTFKYRLQTPYRVVGSIAYVLRETQDVRRQRGFLSADVEYVHYRSLRYRPYTDEDQTDGADDYLKEINRAIRDRYRGAFNLRVGGELKFTTLMVRAGAGWQGNPYREGNGGSANRLHFSGGLGYRHKGYFIDLTYVHQVHNDIHAPYQLSGAPWPVAETRRTQGNVLATFGVKF